MDAPQYIHFASIPGKMNILGNQQAGITTHAHFTIKPVLYTPILAADLKTYKLEKLQNVHVFGWNFCFIIK